MVDQPLEDPDISKIRELFDYDASVKIEPCAHGGFNKVFYVKTDSEELAIKKVEIIPRNLSQLEKDGILTNVSDLAGIIEREVKPAIRLRSRLNHEHILPILHHIQDGQNIYYSEDWFKCTLEDRLRETKTKTLKADEAVRLFKEIIDGLSHLHLSFPHRDLKENNIGLVDLGDKIKEDKRYSVRLFDFGTSRYFDKPRTSKWGTLETKPPEVIGDNKQFTESGDVYSAGVIFYRMLIRKYPFSQGLDKIVDDSGNKEAVKLLLANMRKEDVHRKIRDDLRNALKKMRDSKEIVDITMRCIDPNPGRRYQNAGEVKSELDSLEREHWRKRLRRFKYAGLLALGIFVGSYILPPLKDHWAIYNSMGLHENPRTQVREVFELMSANEWNLFKECCLTNWQLSMLRKSLQRSASIEDAVRIPRGEKSATIDSDDYIQTMFKFIAEEREKPYYCDGKGDNFRLAKNRNYIFGVPVFLEKGTYEFETKAIVHRWFYGNYPIDSKKAGEDIDKPEDLIITVGDNSPFRREVRVLDTAYTEGGKFFNIPADPESDSIKCTVDIDRDGCYLVTIQNGLRDPYFRVGEYFTKDMLVGPTTIRKIK